MHLETIKGAIHVHSKFSDGTGSVDEIARAAQRAGLDFVVISDHDTTEAAERGLAGRREGILVVVGAEISPSHRGHCLALGTEDVTGYRWMPEQFFLHKLHRDGADTYIAHPEGRVKRKFGINLKEWHSWEGEHFTGIEIWSYMHDWVENLSYLTLPKYYFDPDKAIDGPDERVLGLWDRLNMHRRVVGIGALDAHAVKMALGMLVAFEYEFLFKTILTHVLVERWGQGEAEDTSALLEGLRLGRAYVSYEAAGRGEGFIFAGEDGKEMGARGAWAKGMKLKVRAPVAATLGLIRNGRLTARAEGREAVFEADEPGLYRVEARLGGRPWVYSNPIYLGAGEGEAQAQRLSQTRNP